MTAQAPEPIVYSHSLKLEETAKGLRISVHLYGNDGQQLIQDAFRVYLDARQTAYDSKDTTCPYGSVKQMKFKFTIIGYTTSNNVDADAVKMWFMESIMNYNQMPQVVDKFDVEVEEIDK
jgi:hypothetical protein